MSVIEFSLDRPIITLTGPDGESCRLGSTQAVTETVAHFLAEQGRKPESLQGLRAEALISVEQPDGTDWHQFDIVRPSNFPTYASRVAPERNFFLCDLASKFLTSYAEKDNTIRSAMHAACLKSFWVRFKPEEGQ